MKKELFFIAGLSGAGKSTCLKHFEDLEIDVIRGLPIEFLDNFLMNFSVSKAKATALEIFNKALITRTKEVLDLLNKYTNINSHIIFLKSNEDVLLLRYKESRRKHPINPDSIIDGIHTEEKKLDVFYQAAEYRIDTTRLTPYELKLIINKTIALKTPGMKIVVMSFSYRDGAPLEADCVFDVRFLKNPYYDHELKALTGQDDKVIDFFSRDKTTRQFIKHTEQYLETIIELLKAESRDIFYIAFGCTGGLHRSVYIAEQIYSFLRSKGANIEIYHKKLETHK